MFTFEYEGKRFSFLATTKYENFAVGFIITPYFLGVDLLFVRFTLHLLTYPDYQVDENGQN